MFSLLYLISESILICAELITGISARPVNKLIIKASGVLIFEINSSFLQECVMLRLLAKNELTDDMATSVNSDDSNNLIFIYDH